MSILADTQHNPRLSLFFNLFYHSMKTSPTHWKLGNNIYKAQTISNGCTPKETMLEIQSLIIWAYNLDFQVPGYIFQLAGPVLKHQLTQTQTVIARV